MIFSTSNTKSVAKHDFSFHILPKDYEIYNNNMLIRKYSCWCICSYYDLHEIPYTFDTNILLYNSRFN